MALFQTDLKVNDTYILKGRKREIRRCLELTDRSVKFVRLTGPNAGRVSWGTLTKNPNGGLYRGKAIPIAVELVEFEEA